MQKSVSIGYMGEQYSRSVVIELCDRPRWPNAFISLAVIRPGEDTPYLAAGIQVRGNALEWTPNGYDTAKHGTGKAVVLYTEDRDAKVIVGKSPVILVEIGNTLPKTDEAEIPDPYQAWVATLLEIPTEAYQHEQGALAAQEAAETAQGKAEDAQEAAETAQGKAEDAQTAAETAQGKAEDAQTAAETAQGKAEDAQTAAETAQGKAETAQGKAEDAQTAAETAQGKAETAQGKAEDAQGAAEIAQGAAAGSAQAAATSEDNAEAWANGTKDGTPVSSSDPAYHNNAKYYSDSMAATIGAATQQAVAEASGNAEAWADGQRAGVDVQSTDPAYHNNAKYYAQQAGGSATAAAGSEDDAEAWAKGTKNGTAVPTTDPAYHNNAKYYAEQAEAVIEQAALEAVVQAVAEGTAQAAAARDKAAEWATGGTTGTPGAQNNAKYYSEESADSAKDAEAWAVGQRGGVDVGSTDPTYHNNAAYWAAQAHAITIADTYRLMADMLPGTTQEITFGADGNVQKITHKAGSTTEREDVFTFAANTITETRTLDTGDVLTIVTNTETLATSVTVTAAA